MNNDYRFENRKFVVVGIVVGIVLLFIARLFYLQIMNDEYKNITNVPLDRIVSLDQAAVEYIAKSGFDKNYGARPIRRAIQTKIEDEIADRLLSREIKAGDKIVANIIIGDK